MIENQPFHDSLTQRHPILGELKWHAIHRYWHGSIAGSKGPVGFNFTNLEARDSEKLSEIATHVQKIIKLEEQIKITTAQYLYASGELLTDEMEQFVSETRILCIEPLRDRGVGVIVYLPGGELLNQYEIHAVLDESMTVKGACIP